MDQVRTILKLLWRERFWVLSVLGILVAFICWQMSSSALDAEFSTRKSAIVQQVKAMQDLSGKPDHPNDKVNEANREQSSEQSKNVLAVWQKLYDRQRKEVLSWPKDSLKPDFIAAIEQLKFRDPFPVDLSEDMRNHYWNYIGRRFDGLLEIVKALKTEDRGGGRFSGGRGGGGMEADGVEFEGRRPSARMDGEEVDQDYLVEWLDQGDLRAKLEFKTKPTAVQIWVTQEDLWVYETLLNVIAATNEKRGATRPDNTAVRVIEELDVGREAATTSRTQGSILIPRSMATGEGGEMGEMEERSFSEDDYEGGSMRDGGELGEASDEEVLAKRYLDPTGKPYASGPEDKEYRRLPVRMVLEMDQRYLPQLLVECANAALPVEVKQVRVNPDASGAGFGGGTEWGVSPSRSSSRGPRRSTEEIEDPNLALVEVRGVVVIYNEPDESIFEGLLSDDGQLADVSAGQ